MRIIALIGFCCFLISCNSKDVTSVSATVISSTEIHIQDSVINVLPEYNSIIRKETSVKIGEVYFDTLTFLTFDGDYDYWFGEFKTSQLDTVYLVYDDFIKDDNVGNKMILQWKVDSLYEAGEGDELYYQERLITYKVL